MAVVETKHFGPVEFDEASALEFPRGLPGFENSRRFLPLHQAENAPLIFLQSLENPALCFVTVPVFVVDSGYRLHASAEDLASIGLPPEPPRIGTDVLCLAVLSLREEGPTANLLAPVIANLANRKCVQAVMSDSGYSHRQPLCAEEAVACS